jgi:hypothetical protein
VTTWRGYDHNGECLDCDEHADGHTPECPYWTQPVADLVAKLQCLVDWADGQGLLEDHVFTFPDGDIWAATPRKEP